MIDQSLISTNYIAISPWDGTSKVQSKITEAGYAVVFDGDGFWGILTPQDIIRNNHRLVIDCVAPSPYITPNDTLRTALNLMKTFRVNVLPCCGNGKFYGVVSRTSITEHTLSCTEDLAEALDSVHLSNKKLEESERKFRHIVEIIGEGIALVNTQEKFVFANTAAHTIFNLNYERLEGKKISSFLSQQEYAKFKQSTKVAQEQGRSTKEIEILSKSGITKHLLVTTTPNFDDYGILSGTYCVFRDITQRKKTLTALKEKITTLNERVKELNCLYKVSKLIETQDKSLDEIFHELIKLIPNGYRYPIITYVNLIINGKAYKTPNCIETPWSIHCNILVDSKNVGIITVGYTEQKEEVHDGPFHLSEKNMLNAIAGHLGGVVERRQNQEALRIKDLALASSINAIAISDLEGNIKYINSAFLELWGYNSESEVIGMSFINLWQNVTKVNKVKSKLLSTGKYPITGIAKRKDGTLFYADTKSSLVYNEKNEPVAAIGVFVDITKQKKVNNELKAYRNRLEQLVKERTFELNEAQRIAKIGSWKYNNLTKQLRWSDEIYRIFEKCPETFIPTYNSFTSCLNAKYEAAIKKIYSHSLKTKQPYALEYQIVTESGKSKWLLEQGETQFNSMGQHTHTIGTVQDITHRKNLELELMQKDEEFELFFENINEVVLILDANGNTVYTNSIFEKIFDISITEQKKKPLAYLKNIHPEDISGLTEFIINQTDNPESQKSSTIEFRINQKNGSTLWLMVKAIPVFSINKEFSRLIMLFSDITHQKLMHREILNAIVSAEEKERTRFAQDLHDGIGPLLSTSKLYLQWLKRPDTISKKDNLLIQAENTIEEAIKCTREISHNLSPSLLTRYGLISALNSFVTRVKETQSINIKFTHNVKLRLQHQTETSIYRVVTECINNAIKHSDATELSVNIKQIPEKLHLSINDNGKGFDLKEVLSKKKGLGIINMNNRIDTLGGKISINTTPGEGTIISIEIPTNQLL